MLFFYLCNKSKNNRDMVILLSSSMFSFVLSKFLLKSLKGLIPTLYRTHKEPFLVEHRVPSGNSRYYCISIGAKVGKNNFRRAPMLENV